MSSRYRQVKLISPQDKTYRRFCSDRAIEKWTIRPKRPPSALARLSQLFEAVVRELLSERFMLNDKRILAFEERKFSFGYQQKYREIDAVSLNSGKTPILFEIKTCGNPNLVQTIFKAKRQLKTSQNIASFLYPAVNLSVVTVDLYGDCAMAEFASERSEITLCKDLAFLGIASLSGIILPGEDIWHEAIVRGMVENNSLWKQAIEEIEVNRHLRQCKETAIALGCSSQEAARISNKRDRDSSISQAPKFLQFGEVSDMTAMEMAFLRAQNNS